MADSDGGLAAVYQRLAESQPQAPAVTDSEGTWSYAQLWARSAYVAARLGAEEALLALAAHGCDAPRPLAISMRRGREWYAVCIAAWRLGLPVVALSSDLPDKATERDRSSRVACELSPVALVVDGPADQAMPDRPVDCMVWDARSLFSGANSCNNGRASTGRLRARQDSILCYVYTGGTTKHSKCVAITHAMALWEMENYATALGHSAGPSDRFLQYSSAYWGAAVFGQIDLGLAFGACIVIEEARTPDAIAKHCIDYDISVLGIVPSQLRGAWPAGPGAKPRCLRVVVSWAEKLPVRVSKEWRSHVKLYELLIASEYWLTLHSDCTLWRDPADGIEKHVLWPLPGLDMRLLKEDGSSEPYSHLAKSASPAQPGEMLLAGPTVSPGYVGPGRKLGEGPENQSAFMDVDGRRYYRTKDRLRQVPGGGLVYCGRADSLAKRGGAWFDLEAAENTAASLPSVEAATLVAGEERMDSFVVLNSHPAAPFLQVLDQLGRALGAGAGAGSRTRMHIRCHLPLHPATAKIDRRRLLAQLEASRSRDVERRRLLQSVQWRMIKNNTAWYAFVLFILWCRVVLPFVVALSAGFPWNIIQESGTPVLEVLSALLGALLALVLRVLLCPYAWAASLYTWGEPQRFYMWESRPWGFPDLMFLPSLILPQFCLGGFFFVTWTYLAWLRDRSLLFALTLLTILVILLFTGPRRLWDLGFVANISPMVHLFIVYWVAPAQFRFLVGLPFAWAMSFPKWIRDFWEQRADSSKARLRLAVLAMFPGLRKPKFDGHVVWEETKAVVDWGDRVRYPTGKLGRAGGGEVLRVDFWNAVTPVRVHGTGDSVNGIGSSQGNGAVASASSGQADPPAAEPVALSPLEAAVAALVDKAGGRPPSLTSLDSLQAINLVELLRRELGKFVSVTDVLRCSDVHQLAAKLAEMPEQNSGAQDSKTESRLWSLGFGAGARGRAAQGETDEEAAYHVYMMRFAGSPVDWYLHYPGPDHVDVKAFERALDRVVARHSALRTIEAPDEPMRVSMDAAAATWQVWVSCLGSSSPSSTWWKSISESAAGALFSCWPRTKLQPASSARISPRIPLKLPVHDWEEWKNSAPVDHVFWATKDWRSQHRWPFDVWLIPVYVGSSPAEVDKVAASLPETANAADVARALPPSDVMWYLYAGITHAYSDGATGRALFVDLLRIYQEETELGEAAAPRTDQQPPEHFAVLQRRLWRSLIGRPSDAIPDAGGDIYHEIVCEDWGKRPGMQRKLKLQPQVLKTLRAAATDVIGCGADVAWLTAISGALFRLFPDQTCFYLILKCSCRDGPGEAEMVGFLSEQRVLEVDVGDTETAALLDVALKVDTARRTRSWRAPEPFEAALCVYVNIVSSMLDSLPFGCRHVTKEAPSMYGYYCDAYTHINFRLDQRTDIDWDFRIFHWDALWGWEWSTYFGQALAETIADMARNPTGPLVPRSFSNPADSLPPASLPSAALPSTEEDAEMVDDAEASSLRKRRGVPPYSRESSPTASPKKLRSSSPRTCIDQAIGGSVG